MTLTGTLLIAGLVVLIGLIIVFKILKFAVTKILIPVAIVYAIILAWQRGYIPP